MSGGVLSAISALPFAKLEYLVRRVAEPILKITLPGGSDIPVDVFTRIVMLFFTKSYSVFLGMIIFGLCVLAMGIFLKFYGVGVKVNNLVSKFKKKPEEPKKEEKKEEKKTVKKNNEDLEKELKAEEKKEKKKKKRKLLTKKK